ncbi:MAG TPA: histidine phosphatase family protein [Pyrinomonadaceae bacterium]|nr:histidine phosphatase family protein [Pyrinomonadaceae bacterium]
MKTLFLLRHAKSSWKDDTLDDIDRPLKKRGLGDAQLIGKVIRQKEINFDLVLSSPAERARQTTQLVSMASGNQAEIKYDERIYEAGMRRLLTLISRLDNAASTVLLVGHNPGFEELLKTLTGEIHGMPTAALAGIEFEVDDWALVKARTGKLTLLLTPKELRDES